MHDAIQSASCPFNMTQVFFTTDVEIWCDGWRDIDRKFPEAFRRYIYGPTPHGERGVAYQARVLNEHGLKGTFFVEPLFALRFGLEPLAEIVGLIQEAGQEVQLHLHTEWVDEARETVFPHVREKRQHLRYFSLDEQRRLIALGKQLLEEAGALPPVAFRAGSFGLNSDTLLALPDNGIPFDSSYNACLMGMDSGVAGGQRIFQPVCEDGIREYPLTVFQDRAGHYRHAQLGACSYGEMAGLLRHAADANWESVVILSHSFELLNSRKDQPDKIVDRRFRRLCELLAAEQDRLPTTFFADLVADSSEQPQPPPFRSPVVRTLWRTAEQLLRRLRY